MRLLRIEIEGITSLKEKTVIDFVNDLEGEDLFGITGPTGSGKSTILNCISIALYYKSHKDLNPEDFVSLGAKRGRILLDFEMNGDKYTSKWECSLFGVRGKKLKDPKPTKEFYKNDQPLDTKKITPETIIGLDEDQFQKTVIINQGKFSDFITSSFKDRKVLLEKIYTTENITNFPSFLNKEISKLNSEKALKESTIQGGLPITEEEFENNQKRQKVIERELEVFNEQKAYIDIVYNGIKDIIENADKINKSKEDIIKVKRQLDEVSESLLLQEKTLIKTEKALEQFEIQYRKDAAKIQQGLKLSDQISSDQIKCEKCNNSLNENIEIQSNEKQKLNQITKELDDLNTKFDKLKKELPFDVSKEKIVKLEHYISQTIQLNTELTGLEKATKRAEEKLTNSETRGSELSEELNQLKKDLVDSDIEEKVKILDDKIATLEKLKNELSLIEMKVSELTEKTDQKSKEKEQKNKIINTHKQDIEKKRESLNKTIQEFELIQKEIKLHDTLKAIKHCVEIAKEKDECPVCGNNELERLNDISQNFKDYDFQSNRLEELATEKTLKADKLKESELELKNLENRKIEISNELIQHQETIAQLLKNGSIEITNNDFKEHFKKLKQEYEVQINTEKEAQKNLSELKSKIALKNNEIQNERKNYIKLKNEYEIYKKDFSDKSESQAKNSQLICEIVQLSETLKIETLNELLKSSRQYIEIENSLLAKTNLLNNQDNQIKRIQSLIEKLTVEKNDLEKQLQENKNSLNSILNELETKDLIKFKAEKEAKHKELQKLKETETKKTHDIQLKKGQLATQIQYKEENIESLENLVLKYIKNLGSRKLPKNLNDDFKDVESKVLKIASHEKAHFEDWEIENITAFHDDVLSYHFHNFEERIREMRDESVEIKTLNNSYMKKVEEFQKIGKEIAQLEQLINKKQKVKDVIGRDEFTRFAISMIEEQLILMANQELEKLCDGRYTLFQQEKNKTKGPEFFIKDLWRSSSERPLQSLSGGETFMVSLAMALGLAEMSRGQTEIDTFFIDEGFGTLDQDSLEEVLNILMSIRSRGKQIGIISHVKELTDRLPIRLQLNKNQLGESQLEISTY